MFPPKVQVVVLQYNNSQDTVKCLESLKGLDYPNFSVLVIDNGSDSHHLNNVERFIQNSVSAPITYNLKPMTYNSGYSGGNNIGLKRIIENGADYALILNNDTTVERDFLAKLVEVGESDPKIGILGPAILEVRPPNQVIEPSSPISHTMIYHNIVVSRKVYGGKIKWLKPELSHSSQLQIYDPRLYVPGTAMLIKKEVIENIGLLDERYFLYFEDADYCLRASRAGYGLKIVSQALVHHRISSSARRLGAPMLLRYHFRNALLFNRKNGPIWVKVLLPFWTSFIIIKQLIKIIIRPAKGEISRAILNGVLDFYLGHFGKIT